MRSNYFAVLACGLLGGCIQNHGPFPEALGEISGWVVKGPVAGGNVKVSNSAMEVVGSDTTEADGSFTIELGAAEGDFRVCVSNGSFVGEATNSVVRLGTAQLCSAVLGFEANEKREQVPITPLTHWAMVLADCRAANGTPWESAYEGAVADLDAHFICAGPLTSAVQAIPADFTLPGAVTELDAGAIAGLWNFALSYEAKRISELLGLQAGLRVNGLSLTSALAEDLGADCLWDGFGTAGRVSIDGHELNSNSVRSALAQAARRGLQSDRNKSGLVPNDVEDLLLCATASAARVFAPNDPPGRLDKDVPDVGWQTPDEDMVISGSTRIAVVCSDESALASCEFAENQPYLFDVVSEIAGTKGTLSATFQPTDDLSDGPVSIRVRAADTHANETISERTITVDRTAPRIQVLSPTADAVIQDTLVIVASASDAQGEVVRLECFGDLALKDTEEAPDRFESTFDTWQLPDSELVLRLEAEDLAGTISQTAITLSIDNREPGRISGCTMLDSALANAVVELLELDGSGAVAGSPLATAISDTDGCFELTAPDTISGWLLIRSTRGVFTSGGTGSVVVVPADFPGLMAPVHYEPGRPATFVESRAVHAGTSLAFVWAVSNLVVGNVADLDEAIRLGNELVGQHLGGDSVINLGETYARDLMTGSTHSSRTSEAETRLGLLHAGLGQCARDITTANGTPATSLSSVDLLAAWYTDIANGLYDGVDSQTVPVVVQSFHRLSPQSLRWDLAQCIVEWLNSVRNSTGLTTANFSQAGGFLESATENDEPRLFGTTPPQAWDQSPPDVVSQLVGGDGYPLDLAVPATGVISLVINSSDPAGFAAVDPIDAQVLEHPEALGGNQLLPPKPGDTITLAQYPLYTTALEDGPYTVQVVVTDSLGNKSDPQKLDFVVDNTPPTVTASTSSLVAGASATLSWIVNDGVGPLVLLEAFMNDAATAALSIPSPAASGSSALPITCDAVSNWRVEVTDAAGHTSSDTGSVAADCNSPAISVQSSTYRNEEGQAEVTGPTSLDVPDGPEVDITAGMPTIHKYRHRYCGACRNMPHLDFAVSDTGSVASAAADLLVQYRYGSGPWRVPAGGSGSYSIELSADNLAASILTTSPTTLHTITLQAEDNAGNATTKTFTFYLDLMPVPLILSGCGLSSQLTAKKIRSNTFAAAFGVGSRPKVVGQVYWPFGVNVAPENLRITLAGARTKTRFLKERAYTHSRSGWSWVPGTARCAPPYYELPGSSECASGSAPAEYESCPGCDQFNDDLADSMAYSVAGAAVDGPNSFRIAPNQAYPIAVSAQGPEVYIGGEMFLWTTAANGRYKLATANGGQEVTDTRRTCIPGDPCRTEKYRRTFRADRYVYEARIDAGALVVTASETAYSETPPVLLWGDCGKALWYLTNVGGEQSGTF